ncbi:WXG100 family type VII secretion target [Nonomuraea maritima]|uniref:WXG100 family type VII secretion target n=1 Tax=Nonomuraea maritima TaxID=683260 RepID=UPI00371936C9
MAYEDDLSRFVNALALATAAAAVMPYASPLVALMGMLVADPREQDRGGDLWLDRPPGDADQPVVLIKTEPEWRPPMAAEVRNLQHLRTELRQLAQQIGESGDWKGRAYESFLEKVQLLDQHLTTLDDNRRASGEALKSSAQATHYLLMVCEAFAGLLSMLATYVMLARATAAMAAVAALNAERQAITLTAEWHRTLSRIFAQHWKIVLKVSAIMAAVGIGFNQFTQDLPLLSAVPDKRPNVMEAAAIYDVATSDIVDDPRSQLDSSKLEDASIMPEIGW